MAALFAFIFDCKIINDGTHRELHHHVDDLDKVFLALIAVDAHPHNEHQAYCYENIH